MSKNNVKKVSLQFELLNTYYQNSACNLSYTPEITSDELGEKSKVFTAQQLLDMDCNFDQCKFPKDEVEVLPPDELLRQYHEKRTALDHKIDKTLSKIEQILGIKDLR